MVREFYCHNCGLIFWDSPEEDFYRYKYECLSCGSKELIFAVDTMGYFYFAESRREEINAKIWTSPQYVPKEFLKVYLDQGVLIKGEG